MLHATPSRSLAAALLGVCLAAGAARAQGDTVPVDRRYELGVAAGAAYSTDWFEPIAGPDGSPGVTPTAAVSVRYWTTPALGFRLTVGYFGGSFDLPGGGDARVHNLHYDGDITFRPLLARTDVPAILRTGYVFLGRGGLTSFARGGEDDCDESNRPPGSSICLRDGRTVLTTLAGAGADLAGLGRAATLYAELAVRTYSSPARVVSGPLVFAPQGTVSRDVLVPVQVDPDEEDDRQVTTVGLTLGVRFRP